MCKPCFKKSDNFRGIVPKPYSSLRVNAASSTIEQVRNEGSSSLFIQDSPDSIYKTRHSLSTHPNSGRDSPNIHVQNRQNHANHV